VIVLKNVATRSITHFLFCFQVVLMMMIMMIYPSYFLDMHAINFRKLHKF